MPPKRSGRACASPAWRRRPDSSRWRKPACSAVRRAAASTPTSGSDPSGLIARVSTGLAIPVFCASLALTLVATVVFARELDRLSERLGVSEGLHGILTALGA